MVMFLLEQKRCPEGGPARGLDAGDTHSFGAEGEELGWSNLVDGMVEVSSVEAAVMVFSPWRCGRASNIFVDFFVDAAAHCMCTC